MGHAFVGCSADPPSLTAWSKHPTDASASDVLFTVSIDVGLVFERVQNEFFSLSDPALEFTIGIVFHNEDDQDHILKGVDRLKHMAQGPSSVRGASFATTVSDCSPQMYCCFNLVQTRKVKGARRGAVNKALAICTPHRFFQVFQPFLHMTLERLYVCDERGESFVECLEELFTQLNSLDLSDMPLITPIQKQVHWLLDTEKAPLIVPEDSGSWLDSPPTSGQWEMPRSRHSMSVTNPAEVQSAASKANRMATRSIALSSSRRTSTAPPSKFLPERMQYTTHIKYGAIPVPVNIPLCLELDEAGQVSLKALVRCFKEKTAVVYNSILMGARVMFLGYNRPAGEVAQFVLSACLLTSPPLLGTLNRAFPCTTLANLAFLETPGYLAGVTNPMFGDHTAWWDVLCDLNDGSVRVNEKWRTTIALAAVENGAATEIHSDLQDGTRHLDAAQYIEALYAKQAAVDSEFVAKVVSCVDADLNEMWLRSLFRDNTQHILDIALGVAEFRDDKERKIQIEANLIRNHALQQTEPFGEYVQRLQHTARSSRFSPGLVQHMRKLKVSANITEDEFVAMYTAFNEAIQTEDDLYQVLTTI
eukprot:c19539_g1_i1.p1 GENE.c19539_g1_i1~~c19539_g1_i1.p1  ORF type:complete len:590 (+),score=142.68 c19539_g1_i1:1-1770(+)